MYACHPCMHYFYIFMQYAFTLYSEFLSNYIEKNSRKKASVSSLCSNKVWKLVFKDHGTLHTILSPISPQVSDLANLFGAQSSFSSFSFSIRFKKPPNQAKWLWVVYSNYLVCLLSFQKALQTWLFFLALG